MSLYPWQQSKWRFLLSQYQQGRLPHAILCKGPAALGKFDFAQQLAQYVLCEKPLEVACGQCRACRLFLSGHHPDYYAVRVADKSHSIKVEQIRDLIGSLTQTASRHGFQVVFIYPAEKMNRASSNALLKMLEEPPGQVIFILVAHQLATIPVTLVSRCQTIYFTSPPMVQSLSWLQQQLDINEEKARLLLQLAEGAPLRALEMGNSGFQELRNQIVGALQGLIRSELLVSWVVEQWLKQDLAVILHVIFTIVMDVLRICLQVPASAITNQDCFQQLQQLGEKINLLTLVQWLPQLLQDKHRLQSVPGINVQLLMEGVLLSWQKCAGKEI